VRGALAAFKTFHIDDAVGSSKPFLARRVKGVTHIPEPDADGARRTGEIYSSEYYATAPRDRAGLTNARDYTRGSGRKPGASSCRRKLFCLFSIFWYDGMSVDVWFREWGPKAEAGEART
jgi:hypothetical protein